MDLPACLIGSDGALTLGSCKPFGLGLVDWAKLFGFSLAAFLIWFFRSILIPVGGWPFKFVATRRAKKNWPRISNEHGHTDRRMVGREGALARLREILAKGDPTAITNDRKGIAAVRGYGGVGKTFTAYNYLSLYRSSYEVVWLVPGETLDGLHEALIQLGRHLGQTVDPTIEPKSAALQTLHQLARLGNPVLVLFDNVFSPRDIQPYLIEPGRVHYLITSRHDDWAGVAKDFPLGLLDLENAIRLLTAEANRDDPDFKDLAEDLGRLPLALVIAGAYLRTNPAISIGEYRASLVRRLEDAPANDEYDKSVYASVTASYERLDQEARTLANFCAFLAPDDIDPQLIETAASHVKESALKSIAIDRIILSRAFAKLRSVGLLERSRETIHSMHRLTGAVIRSRLMHDESHGQWASAVTMVLLSVMPEGSASKPEVWPYCAVPVLHVANLVESVFPLVEENKIPFLTLLSRAAEYLDARGHFEEAISYWRICQQLTAEVYGERSLEYGGVLHRFGSLLVAADRLDAAEDLHNQALQIAREHFPADHLNVGLCLMNIAAVYWKRGELAKAAPLAVEAYEMTVQSEGKDSLAAMTVSSNLASLYGRLGRYDEAFELAEVTATSIKTRFGVMHPDMVPIYHNLAGYQAHRRNWKSAVEYVSKAFAISTLLGLEDHPYTRSILASLTNILTDARMKSALRLLKKDPAKFVEPTIKSIQAEQEAYLATKINQS